ncbi:hypothetical protein KY362_07160 [Candidatus Woesearchaeota archaeon]|nr:hypothetical protein [Candidatus Woesearchaeota archaeon]
MIPIPELKHKGFNHYTVEILLTGILFLALVFVLSSDMALHLRQLYSGIIAILFGILCIVAFYIQTRSGYIYYRWETITKKKDPFRFWSLSVTVYAFAAIFLILVPLYYITKLLIS